MKNQIEKTKIELGGMMKRGGIFGKIRDRFFLVPKNVRLISLSMFIFMLGRGVGGDTFYSVFIETIVENVFWVSLIGALLPLIKLFVAPAAGEIIGKINNKWMFTLSKILFAISGLFYVLAGVLKNEWFLLLAVIFNGIGSSCVYVAYYSSVHENCDKNHSEVSRGLFYTGMNGAYTAGALISAVLVYFINLPYLYIFITVFSILSLLIDLKIPFKKGENNDPEKNNFAGFLSDFSGECFSISPVKKMYTSVKNAKRGLLNGLGYEMLYAILDYLSLLFIPLIALENGLGLPQIALVFAAMRLPYIFNLFVSGWDEGFNKKLFIAVVLIFLAGLFILLGFDLSFWMILVVSFCIAFGLSVMKPVISAMITEHTNENEIGLVSGAEQFVTFFGDIVGALGFGVLTSLFSMDIAFFLVGLSLAVLATLSFFKRGKERVKKIRNK